MRNKLKIKMEITLNYIKTQTQSLYQNEIKYIQNRKENQRHNILSFGGESNLGVAIKLSIFKKQTPTQSSNRKLSNLSNLSNDNCLQHQKT